MSQTLTCPKCQSEMRSYERNRVLVDQCTGCGGIFLDKGELEALSAAENAWHQQAQPEPQQAPDVAHQQQASQPQAPPAPPQYAAPPQQPYAQPQQPYTPTPQPGYAQPYPSGQRYANSKQRYAQGYPGGQRYASSKQRYGQHKRKSFLDDLFG
ncbi:TFIIB-type zinc ribbon-containing protein [Luteipulveratus halotolerans]|uniref:TFIIB-type zinc ribbon-containing protein n=1 Tax=Luteipulveratus halotolerans TaxID=1631356 RepID=UPI0008FBF893|nr:zf-TFIIB domain-containing protein [Luteipulveratus halotolerans]